MPDKKVVMFGRDRENCPYCQPIWDMLAIIHAKPDNRPHYKLEKRDLADSHNKEYLLELGLSNQFSIPITVFLVDGKIWDHDKAVIVGARDWETFKKTTKEFVKWQSVSVSM